MGEPVLWNTFQGDAHIDFQGLGTLVMDDPTYDDLQFPVASGRVPASNAPNWEAFGSLNASEFAFGVGEFIDCQANEPTHGWKEGSDIEVHLHFATKTAQNSGSSQFVKFEVWVQRASPEGTWNQVSFTNQAEIPTGTPALKHFLIDIGTMTMDGYEVGTQMKVRVRRAAATGTEYAADVFITQIGMHLQQDTLGSREIYNK